MLLLIMELNHFFEGSSLKKAALGGIEPTNTETPKPKKDQEGLDNHALIVYSNN